MATKVDASPVVESPQLQNMVSSNSSKVSKFGSKTGFVIPKNKLLGSLVPAIRGGSKLESGTTAKEDVSKQLQRKTKWAVDMTQEAGVKKGRIMAYQTRLEQITEQLKNGTLEVGNAESSRPSTLSSTHDSAKDLQTEEPQILEQLELEKREIIGEILQLNPNFKVPPDYKPLMKEENVPIPIKRFPEYNFIGLLLGSESNNLKRLEEETGAKIAVYGIKSSTKEKREVTRSDISAAQTAYEELYVNVSADTYNKVDAAVALIELLVTPVSGSAVAVSTGDNSADDPGEKPLTTSHMMTIPALDQPAAVLPAQFGSLQYQTYPGSWYPISSSGPQLQPPSGFTPSPMPHNSVRFPPTPMNPSNMPPSFGAQPPLASAPRNSPGGFGGYHPATQPMNQAFPHPNSNVPVQRSQSPHPAMPVHPVSNPPSSFPLGPQVTPAGPMQSPRPFPGNQPVALAPANSSSIRSPALSLAESSFNWPGAPSATSLAMRPNNSQMASPMFPQQRPFSGAPPSSIPLLSPQQSISPPLPNSFPALVQQPTFVPSAVPRPWSFSLGSQNYGLVSAMRPVPVQVSMQSASVAMSHPHAPMPPVLGSDSGSVPNYPPANSLMTNPSVLKPPRPTSGDFTFQPLAIDVRAPLNSPRLNNQQGGQVPAQMPMMRPSNRPAAQIPPQIPAAPPIHRAPLPQNRSQFPPAAPQGPFTQNTPQVLTGLHQAPPFMPLGATGLPRNLNQFDQHGLSGNPAHIRLPSGPPHFPNSMNAAPLASMNLRGPPNFFPGSQGSNMAGGPLMRPSPLMPPRNQIPGQPRGLSVGNQQMVPSGLPGHQSYNPFLPTSIRPPPLQKPDVRRGGAGKPETDAEYEDLMASVGVR